MIIYKVTEQVTRIHIVKAPDAFKAYTAVLEGEADQTEEISQKVVDVQILNHVEPLEVDFRLFQTMEEE